jgi:hypothetical protein
MNDLPRQARNKHKENSSKHWRFLHSVDTALFTSKGAPYPVKQGTNWLNGTVENCNTLSWPSTHTLWCRNGSSAACTVAPAPPPDGLADYGSASNLLECVPTYIHKVASLNAANAWMMRETASLMIATTANNASRVSELRSAADKLSELVRSKLYVRKGGSETGGYWACEQPDGKLVAVRHVIDFITIGAALLDDLSNSTKDEMVAFVKRELLTKNWMRALSVSDLAAPRCGRHRNNRLSFSRSVHLGAMFVIHFDLSPRSERVIYSLIGIPF